MDIQHLPELTGAQIKELYTRAGLSTATQVNKIPIGFSNDVFNIDDRYILKTVRLHEDEPSLRREVYLYKLFAGKVPVPVVVFEDFEHATLDRGYFIYEMIQGDTLYTHWHTYSDEIRKRIIGEICGFIKAINATPYDDFTKEFGINTDLSWRERIVQDIHNALPTLEESVLSSEAKQEVIEYVAKHEHVLDSSVMALTYYDLHFNNFLVRDEHIVGMLDFERTDYRSIDFALELVDRLVRLPTKFASDDVKPFIKVEDYAHLLEWYREFCPELFAFPHFEQRIALYTLRGDVKQLFWWPGSEQLRASLRRVLG